MPRPRPSGRRWSLLLGGLLPCAGGWLLATPANLHADDEIGRLFGVDQLEDADWTRHFSIGGVAALNVHASFGLSGNFNVAGHNVSSGIYDDGYVRPDNTGDFGGQTGYWGYQQAQQFNAADNTLTFHSANQFTGSESASVNDPIDAGFQITYGDTEFEWNRAKVGWELGLAFVPITIRDTSPVNVQVRDSSYVYQTGGIIPPGPGYQGGPSGLGEPTIPDTYTTGSTTTNNGVLTGTRTLSSRLYTFRLGPWIYWDLNQRVGLSLGVGPALGLAQNTLTYHETIAYSGGTAVNSGSQHSWAFIYGGYVNGTLIFHAPEKADIFVGAQYMPMSDVEVSGGGRRAQLDLGGQIYLSAGVNWSF